MAAFLDTVQRFRKIEEATAQKDDPAPIVSGFTNVQLTAWVSSTPLTHLRCSLAAVLARRDCRYGTTVFGAGAGDIGCSFEEAASQVSCG